MTIDSDHDFVAQMTAIERDFFGEENPPGVPYVPGLPFEGLDDSIAKRVAAMVEACRPSLPPNPKAAFGDKKPPLHLVPPALEIGASKALGEGAVKYGAYNWRERAVEVMTYVAAMKRHLAQYADGEDIDPESTVGKHHIEGIAACCAIVLDCLYAGTLIDNRPPKGPAPAKLRMPKENA